MIVNRASERVDVVKTIISTEERTPRGSSETTRSTSSDDTVRSRSSLDSVRPSSESREDSLPSRSSLDGSRSSLVNQRSTDKLTLGTSRKRSATLTLSEAPELKKKDRKKLEKEAKKQDKKKAAAISAVPLVHVTTASNTLVTPVSPRKDSQPVKRQKALSLTRKPNYPSARCMHASVAMGREIYIFGGKNQDSTALKDMFVFDTGT